VEKRTLLKTIILMVVAMPLSTTNTLAQQDTVPGFTHQETAIGEVAIRWYLAHDRSIREQRKAVVISEVTTGGSPKLDESRREDPDPGGFHLERRLVGFSPSILDSIRMDVPGLLATCDSFDIATLDLCGVQGSWVWLVLSNVDVLDDRATLILHVRSLNWKYEYGAGRPWRDESTYTLLLKRQGATWQVESFRLSGVA
jgi:hypothetical protein